MTDPLDALREPVRPIDPDPAFAAALRARLERLVLGVAEEPPAALTGSVVPYLAVPDAAAALDFYVAAFGAARRGDPIRMPDGRIGHAELTVGDGVVMLADEFPEMGLRAPAAGAVSVSLHLEVADPDAVVARAAALGARIERPVTDSPYGRGGVVLDPAGHRWMVMRRPAAVLQAALAAPDPARAARFYGAVLGRPVEAVGGQRADLRCTWPVPDLGRASALVRAAGGSAGTPAHRAVGRVAECADDQGLGFALTTAEPAATEGLAHVTIEVPDTGRARAFYGTVLGWRFRPGTEPGHWTAEGVALELVAGPDPRAVPTFAVPDTRAALRRVREAGGTTHGRECRDDQGGRFRLTGPA